MSKREQFEKNLQRLQQLGFSQYSAKAYMALVRLGKGTASEIAKKAEIPQAKIYGVLDDLYEKGFITKIEDATPTSFVVEKPKEQFLKFLNNFAELADYLDEIYNSAGVESKYGFVSKGNFSGKFQATDFIYIFDMSDNLFKKFFERRIHNYFKVGGPTNSLVAIGDKETIILIEKEHGVQYIRIEDQIFSRMIDTLLALSPSNRHITEEMYDIAKGEPILYVDSILTSSGYIYGQYGTIWISPVRFFIKIPGKDVYARPLSSLASYELTVDGSIEINVARLDGERELSEIFTLSDPTIILNLIDYIKGKRS